VQVAAESANIEQNEFGVGRWESEGKRWSGRKTLDRTGQSKHSRNHMDKPFSQVAVNSAIACWSSSLPVVASPSRLGKTCGP